MNKEEYKVTESESRARKLAQDLSAERKRLKQELSELQHEVEDLTPTTPTGTLDWYVKWVATALAVSGVFLISAGQPQAGNLSCPQCLVVLRSGQLPGA